VRAPEISAVIIRLHVRYTADEEHMRQAVAVLALLTWPGLAIAQQNLSAPVSGLAPIGFPLPPIGLPLSPIGLPLAPVVSPSPSPNPAAARDGRARRGESPRNGRADGSHSNVKHRPVTAPAIVYFGTPYDWSSYGSSMEMGPVPHPTPPEPAMTTGVLRLEMESPELLQLFVDGEYVGTVDDLSGELVLEPGTHRIEIRTPGYEPVAFDARIVQGRTITYRGAMTPLVQPLAVPDERPKRPQTFYLIRGCYLGNIPPEQVRLPPGCESRPVVTYTP
jgi:hypothetical protein